MFSRFPGLGKLKRGSSILPVWLGFAFLVNCFLLAKLITAALSFSTVEREDCAVQIGIVKSFYRKHLAAGNTSYTERNILAKRKWLSKPLFDALVAERKKSAKSDSAPYLNGDPFTDSQEYPSSFSIDTFDCRKAETTVKVTFTNQPETKWVIVKLVLQNHQWKIDNVFYQDGNNLFANLRK
jgi:hypothetical protein